MRNADNIVLVGPMGSGKSSIGRLLATRLERGFVDVDASIEENAGTPIARIFATEGEAAFRMRESDALKDALSHAGQVVATGGGTVLDAGNRAHMRDAGTVVYLRVDPQDQLIRIAGDTDRPLLDVADRSQRLSDLQAEREPFYLELADLVFDTSRHTPESAAEAMALLLMAQETSA